MPAGWRSEAVSSLRVANKAQAELYRAIVRDGGTHRMADRMQSRAELYETIGLAAFEALDASNQSVLSSSDIQSGLAPNTTAAHTVPSLKNRHMMLGLRRDLAKL
jgi:hypothetical protein